MVSSKLLTCTENELVVALIFETCPVDSWSRVFFRLEKSNDSDMLGGGSTGPVGGHSAKANGMRNRGIVSAYMLYLVMDKS